MQQQQMYQGGQQQWQQGQPSGAPAPTDSIGGFQPSSTPGQRILAAAGLLSGGGGGSQQGSAGGPSQDPAAQTQAAMLAGQLDDATLIRLLQERAAQGSFQGQGNPQAPMAGTQQQQQQIPGQQQPFSPQQQQMQPPHPSQFGGSPPQGSGFGLAQQFGGQPQQQMSSPTPMMGGGGPGNQGGQAGTSAGGKPKTRARRGQATDPHSIAERLRRERIAERMRALQELVPNSNKVDKASMLDDIIEYVKFLQLQVKVLNLNRLSGPAADAVASLLADLDPNTDSDTKANVTPQELELTERQVALLMEQDMGMAMQYLQSKGLCLMPTSLANMMNKGKGPKASGQGEGGAAALGPGGEDATGEGDQRLAQGGGQEGSARVKVEEGALADLGGWDDPDGDRADFSMGEDGA